MKAGPRSHLEMPPTTDPQASWPLWGALTPCFTPRPISAPAPASRSLPAPCTSPSPGLKLPQGTDIESQREQLGFPWGPRELSVGPGHVPRMTEAFRMSPCSGGIRNHCENESPPPPSHQGLAYHKHPSHCKQWEARSEVSANPGGGAEERPGLKGSVLPQAPPRPA